MKPRFARQVLLLDPSDCLPPHGLDLSPGSRDSIKVEQLYDAFMKNGFDPKMPALVGYPDESKKIQLLSGTHRHEAATRANILLPVKIILRSTVEAAWGLEQWKSVIADIPVHELEWAEVQPATDMPGLDERIDLSTSMTKVES